MLLILLATDENFDFLIKSYILITVILKQNIFRLIYKISEILSNIKNIPLLNFDSHIKIS